MRKWEDLPKFMKVPEVKPYYDILQKHKTELVIKRIFDVIVGIILFILLLPVMGVIAIAIKVDSPGPIMYRQERVTTYGRIFKIHKFRSMVVDNDGRGSSVTVLGDKRITKVGKFIRRYRLDEISQLIDIIVGDMSFVGTRPEIMKYVEKYQPQFYATLLLPAGVTSEACIRYKDENTLLTETEDVDKIYIEKILPNKMVWNLDSIRRFQLKKEIATMVRTVLVMLGKDYG